MTIINWLRFSQPAMLKQLVISFGIESHQNIVFCNFMPREGQGTIILKGMLFLLLLLLLLLFLIRLLIGLGVSVLTTDHEVAGFIPGTSTILSGIWSGTGSTHSRENNCVAT